MHINDLDYELPESSIAQFPIEPRDAAKLLVVNPNNVESSQHLQISDVTQLIQPGDVVVVNDTRVLRARVHITRRGGGTGEILLLEPHSTDRDAESERVSNGWWEALCRPSRKLPEGTLVHASAGDLAFLMGPDLGDGRRLVQPQFNTTLLNALEQAGTMPLPPYIHTPLADHERYQTVFNNRPVSAAAPTAGLHFTPAILDQLRERGASIVTVELAVGLDTFRPITTEHVEDHDIHSEWFHVSNDAWAAIWNAKAHHHRVIAVGTTAVRALESAAQLIEEQATGNTSHITADESVSEGTAGRTRLFITPGYRFRVVDGLLTNFHLPKSTLLSLLQAFMGPSWRDAYRVALDNDYRFLSFGDAMFVERVDMGE